MTDMETRAAMAALWPHVAPMLAPALELGAGTHTLDDVRAQIEAGKAQLWPTPSTAVVTEVVDTPQARALRFWLCGGKLDEAREIEAQALEWAKSMGCTKALFGGRRGWLRALNGWREYGVLAGKEIG